MIAYYGLRNDDGSILMGLETKIGPSDNAQLEVTRYEDGQEPVKQTMPWRSFWGACAIWTTMCAALYDPNGKRTKKPPFLSGLGPNAL